MTITVSGKNRLLIGSIVSAKRQWDYLELMLFSPQMLLSFLQLGEILFFIHAAVPDTS